MSEYALVLSTCPNGDVSQRLAQTLVEEKLAACVNVVPGLRSFYVWQGRAESSDEQLLIIKTRVHVYPQLEKRLQELHPYELPEILMIPVNAGLPPYLAWISSSVK